MTCSGVCVKLLISKPIETGEPGQVKLGKGPRTSRENEPTYSRGKVSFYSRTSFTMIMISGNLI